MIHDYAIIGGGIVGLTTALALLRAYPGARVVVLEKEDDVARHQTGRNSGVIHSGIYYPTGSLKARMAREGNISMRAFCEEHGLAYEICGKLIVASEESELPRLDNLFQRGQQNGLRVEKLASEQAREIEPHVNCLAALRIPSTGIVSYRAVARKCAGLIHDAGGQLQFATRVMRIRHGEREQVIETNRGDTQARFIVNCAGLHSDRVAALGGCEPGARIVPFRGEYYELIPQKRGLVKGLIYPVPNPAFPFLGVHFTRMVDGSVHAGPNAVLALHREAYSKISLPLRGWRDLRETMLFPGFWKLAAKHWNEGAHEVLRSFSKRAFVRSLQKLVPEITERDIVPCEAGVRAQALHRNGSLVDDFLIIRGKNSLHVCNAPSPAATASFEIAKELVSQIPRFERMVAAAA